MKSVAIMTSGGDAAGMNPAIKCAVEYSIQKGLRPYLVYDGLKGLIDGNIHAASVIDTADIIHRGGTILRSSRSKRFFDYEYRKQAYEHLQRLGVESLIVIGGDGSFAALQQFYKDFKVPFAGIPATIDNDIPCTDYCLGVDTALNVIRQSVDSIRDTGQSFSRAFVIEVMGRDCGYLAMASALACSADICIAPELPYDLDAIGERLRKRRVAGERYFSAVVAEGTGMGEYLTRWMSDTLNMDARLTTLGHVQRGGSPTVRDRVMANEFAVAAVDSLLAGHKDHICVYNYGNWGYKTIDEVKSSKAKLGANLLSLCQGLSK